MKKFHLFLFLIGTIVTAVACQQSFEDETGINLDSLSKNEESIAALNARGFSSSIITLEPEFMPLGVVPEWVKEKVSQEEYGLWNTLSSKCEVDYSVLKERLSQKEKERLYAKVRKVCARISDGSITEPIGRLMFFLWIEIPVLT